jgi:hypothetical protein
MPWAHRITPANGDERAQVLPRLEAVKGRPGKAGRPRKRLKDIATDKGYAAQALRQQLRQRGIRVAALRLRQGDAMGLRISSSMINAVVTQY